VHLRFGGTYCLHFQHQRVSQARNQQEPTAQYLAFKMEVTCSSKTLVDFQQTIWRYIPEDRTLPYYVVRLERFYNIPIELGFAMNLVRLIKVRLN
jgi:hypothetical protein